jgi:membrane-bound serine protease (ClpP class)
MLAARLHVQVCLVRLTTKLMPRLLFFWFALVVPALFGAVEIAKPAASRPRHTVKAVVIPIRAEINEPTLFLLRRGLKLAAQQNIDVVVLDLKTPGGSVDSAFAMMEAIEKFPGHTIAFVDDEAMSAGAFIAATTDEIWFAPRGVIGAAAAVTSQGQDIPETMRLKITSFLRAKIRAVTQGKRYRGDVVSAMIDKDFVLNVDGHVLKKAGELLSLTATEASQTYGDPPAPLLAGGIAEDIDSLLKQRYDGDFQVVERFAPTWSENVAQYLSSVSPILLGLGLLGLFLEFKMPSSGLFGIAGICLLAIVFLSSYVEGLSGHEPALVFAVGMVCLLVEIFVFPGVILPALIGIVLMLGSLVWALADFWPHQPTFDPGVFVQPLASVGLGLLIAIVSGALLLRFLPKSWFFDRLVLTSSVGSSAQIAGLAPEVEMRPLIGREGVVLTPLRPFGQVEIDGQRYEARISFGTAPAGSRVTVVARTEFGLAVDVIT